MQWGFFPLFDSGVPRDKTDNHNKLKNQEDMSTKHQHHIPRVFFHPRNHGDSGLCFQRYA